MEKNIYRCLKKNCFCVSWMSIYDDFIQFECGNNHKEIIYFYKIDSIKNKLFNKVNDTKLNNLDFCKKHNLKYSFFCKTHEQNLCQNCNEDEAHKDCIKIDYNDINFQIDTNIIENLKAYIKQKDTNFYEFIEKIMKVYEENKMNYIFYLYAKRIQDSEKIFKQYFEEGITVKYINTYVFIKDFSKYETINELIYEITDKIKSRYRYENLRFNFIHFYFSNDDKFKKRKYIKYNEEYLEIKNETNGQLQMFSINNTNDDHDNNNNIIGANSEKKYNFDYSTKSILKEALDYGEQTKAEILFDKKHNKEKLIEEEKIIEENYLFNNMENINYTYNIKPSEEEQYSVLSLLSQIIKQNGIETAVYKEDDPSLNDSIIQMMSCNGNKYDFTFDFGEDENKKFIENIDEYDKFLEKIKKDFKKKLNIDEKDLLFSIPKKGSLKFSVAFITPGIYDEKDLESIFKDCKEFKKIHKSVLMEGCKLTKNIFSQKGNNGGDGWEKEDLSRGGKEYIPPYGWTGFGLNILDKYDNGNNNWMSYNHAPNEYCVAYYPIKNNLLDQKEMREYIASLASLNMMNDNSDSFNDIFADDINLNNENEKCGSGIYLYQDIKIAENMASIIDVKGIRYKVLIMCRVNPNKIRIPKSFPKIWILNPNTYEIRQYRILIKMFKFPLSYIDDGTMVVYPQPIGLYRQIINNKNTSFYDDKILKKIEEEKKYNKHEAIIHFYTEEGYFNLANISLIDGCFCTKYDEKNDSGEVTKTYKLSKKQIESFIWCLHSTLTNYYGDVEFSGEYKIKPVKDGSLVYRYLDFPFDTKKYGVGSTFYISTFVSTSLKQNVKSFKDKKCMLKIIIKNNAEKNYCFSISEVSAFKSEDEVLICPYCQFLIKMIEEKDDKIITEMECLGYRLNDNEVKSWPKEDKELSKKAKSLKQIKNQQSNCISF